MKKKLLSIFLVLAMALCFTPMTASAADGGVAINETNFPDKNFLTYVKDNFDKDKSDSLSASELAAVTKIDCNNKNISDLTGIEYFTNLAMLECGNNQLTSFDVSKNTNMTVLYCYDNQLTSLDVSKNTNLKKLYCDANQLTSLDVSKNTNLESLYCNHNQLISLDVSNNTKLNVLSCENNRYAITTVDNVFDLSTLPGGFDVSKVRDWNGATRKDGKLIIPEGVSGVTYKYDIGQTRYETFTLTVTSRIHTHNWSEKWSSNDTAHWHECTAAGCPITKNSEKNGYELHTDENKDNGCNVCGKKHFGVTLRINHKGNYIARFYVHWREINFDENGEVFLSEEKEWSGNGKRHTMNSNLVVDLPARNVIVTVDMEVRTGLSWHPWNKVEILKTEIFTEFFTTEGVHFNTPEEIKIEVAGLLTNPKADSNLIEGEWYFFDKKNETITYRGRIGNDGNVDENDESASETLKEKQGPSITAGNNAKITQGESRAMSFTSDAYFNDFIFVELDDKVLSEENYTVKSGSTIVTLNAEYVATLAAGEHTLDIVSQSGTATAKFTVNKKAEEAKNAETTTSPSNKAETTNSTKNSDKKSPQTGSNLALWFAFILASGGAVTLTTLASKKKRYKK